MSISVAEFDYVRKLVCELSAISLESGKEYLVEARLAPVARRYGLSSVSEFIGRMLTGRISSFQTAVVEAMTTNETSFFRDVHPFETLKCHVLPDLLRRNAAPRKLNIWCGACSTGQEPFTIAMILQEHFPQLLTWNLEFLATDLATEILNRAKEGRYNQLEVSRGLPTPLLGKYFRQENAYWCIKDSLRRMVEFRQMNLADSWPFLPAMDLVFLRNVLIYFTFETKKAILRRISQLLKPGGYLFLGSAETTLNMDLPLEQVHNGKAVLYRRPG